MPTTTHWTARSVEDFVYRISADLIAQLESKMTDMKMSRKDLADALRVSPGCVSQVLNNPGNMTLKKVVEYSRTLGLKVAVVAYDDGDTENRNGPINCEIFNRCWQSSGKPTDFFALANSGIHAGKAMALAFTNCTMNVSVGHNIGTYNSSVVCGPAAFDQTTGFGKATVILDSGIGGLISFGDTNRKTTLSSNAPVLEQSTTTQLMEV